MPSLRHWGISLIAVPCLILGLLLLAEAGTAVGSGVTDTADVAAAPASAPEAGQQDGGDGGSSSGDSSSPGKITLEMERADISFEAVELGTTVTSPIAVRCRVKSNKTWELLYEASGFDEAGGFPLSQLRWGLSPSGSDAIPFASSGAFLTGQPKTGGQDVTHYYTLDMPWTTLLGTYHAKVTYTAVIR
ncbi:MAG TPA: hypothetical protein VGL40_02995 [Bacillota bacterium]